MYKTGRLPYNQWFLQHPPTSQRSPASPTKFTNPHRFLKSTLISRYHYSIMSCSPYPSGWYPTTSSSSPSINLFIPYSSSSSRETHEMYSELGFILRPSKTIPSPTTTVTQSKSKCSLSSSLTKSRSFVMKWLGASWDFPSGRQGYLTTSRWALVRADRAAGIPWFYPSESTRAESRPSHSLQCSDQPCVMHHLLHGVYTRISHHISRHTSNAHTSHNSDLDFPWLCIHCSCNWTIKYLHFQLSTPRSHRFALDFIHCIDIKSQSLDYIPLYNRLGLLKSNTTSYNTRKASCLPLKHSTGRNETSISTHRPIIIATSTKWSKQLSFPRVIVFKLTRSRTLLKRRMEDD